MKYRSLASSLQLGRHTLANRIVMPPMVIWKAGRDATVTEHHLDHYRSSAGAGLIIVEATAVSPEGRLAATQLGAFSDEHVDGLNRLAAVIREGGAVPGIQLHHAGARTDHERNWGGRILAPSRLPEAAPEVEELTEAEIRRIIGDFARASVRVVRAGFELIELHGAHGYLGSQFLSPRTNLRGDRWGGSIENRTRFLVEALSAVRDAASEEIARRLADRPPSSSGSKRNGIAGGLTVTVRLGAAESAGGLTIEDGIRAAKILEEAGADGLHVSHGGSIPAEIVGSKSRWSALIEMGRLVKRAVSIPVIGVGEVRRPEDAEMLIESKIVDLVAVGRAQLADPGWAVKSLAEHEERISLCADCKPRCWHFSDASRCPARQRLQRIA